MAPYYEGKRAQSQVMKRCKRDYVYLHISLLVSGLQYSSSHGTAVRLHQEFMSNQWTTGECLVNSQRLFRLA